MGYRRSTLKLTWPEDSEFAGLEVRLRRLAIGRVFELASLADLMLDRSRIAEAKGALDTVVAVLHKSMLGWNLEDDDGVPVPTTREALLEQDLDLVVAIINAWVDAVTAVAPPLPGSSPSGGLSPVESETLMALTSESLPSSLTPS